MDQYFRQSWESLRDAWHTATSSSANSITNTMTYYTSGGLRNLPYIPCKIQDENAMILALSGYRVAHTVASKVLTERDTTWGSLGVAAILGVCHLEHGLTSKGASESAFHTAMNPYRILEKRESYRLITGQIYHASTTSFMNNIADLFDSTTTIESVWGWQGMLASVSFTSLLGQALYVGSTYLAKSFHPGSDLAREFYRFSTGLSITSIGVKTLSGYLMDGIEMAHRVKRGSLVWRHRYEWSMQLLMTGALLKMSSRCLQYSAATSPYASLEIPSLYASASGVAAGIITSYLFDGPWISPTAGLCFTDIALQTALLGLSIFSLRSM